MEAFKSQFPASNFTLLAVVLALPALGAFVNGVFGKRLGKQGVRFMALAAIGGSFLASLATFVALVSRTGAHGEGHEEAKQAVRLTWSAWHWFSLTGSAGQSIPIDVAFGVDAMSAIMMLVITGIGFLIHLYSSEYMKEDEGFHRYFAYLNLFCFAMLTLVMGDNMVVLFVGWEGVGLCSYLLIGFWFLDEKNAAAGKKAFLVNRIGDFGLILAMAMIAYYCGSLQWTGIEANVTRLLDPVKVWPIGNLSHETLPGFLANLILPKAPIQVYAATLVGLAIFLGCAGKSAQMPLYIWLPDAMAGPTPVSALIHAATMVTAGVYLVARTSFIFVLSPAAMATVAVTGAFTALFAASIGLFQTDLKKVLAYSTVSQLGFMFIGVGVGAFSAGFFHVFTHAFFKATLFLGAGAIIHSLHHEQDMRRMGGLTSTRYPKMFFAFLAMFFGWWAIIGLPLGAGFMSKDLILERLFTGTSIAPVIGWIALATALVTSIYMTRVMVLTFWSPERLSDDAKHHLTGTPVTMAVPLVILGFGSLVAGFVWCDWLGAHAFEDWLAPVLGPAEAFHHSTNTGGAEMPGWMMPVGGSVAALAGLLIAFKVWGRGPRGAMTGDLTGFGKNWTFGFDILYKWTVVLAVTVISQVWYVITEQALVPVSTWAFGWISEFVGESYASLQSGRMRVSLALSIAGLVALLWLDKITDLSTWCLTMLHLMPGLI